MIQGIIEETEAQLKAIEDELKELTGIPAQKDEKKSIQEGPKEEGIKTT